MPSPRAALWLSVLLLGCSDYRFDKVQDVEADGDDTGSPPVGAPVLEASPAAWTPGRVCGDTDADVVLGNGGDAPLTVTELTIEGDGWVIASAPGLPASVAAGDSLGVRVTGQGGPAALLVRSDDPARPELRIPLESSVDLPPEISLSMPGEAGVFAIGTVETLEARVVDEAADGLEVSWSTDVDGVFEVSDADTEGLATAGWVSRDRPAGVQELSVSVTDDCGNTATDAIFVCQAEGYVADELGLESWHFEGTAAWDGSREVVELTSLDSFAVGTAFQVAQAVAGDRIDIRFEFETGGGTGADGLSLTLLDVDRMDGFMGAPGCALGYGEAHPSCVDTGEALPGWSLEVDTYYNPTIDPSSSNHLSLTFDGDLDTVAAWAELSDVEDTGWHLLEVSVDAPLVTVAVDGAVLIDTELPDFVPMLAYVGFTAATGVDTNRHGIRGLEVTGDQCEDWSPL
jgi:hypothetical protein